MRPMLWNPRRHQPLVVAPWNEAEARAAIARIVDDAERGFDGRTWPVHPDDEPERYGVPPRSSIYWGAAGVVYALEWLRRAGFGEREFRDVARTLADRARGGDYLMGEVGALSVAAMVVGSEFNDRLLASIEASLSLPSNELMLGASGVILAARLAYAASWDERFDEVARRGATTLIEALGADDLWTQRLFGGEVRYLGLVHGFAGNAAVLTRVGCPPEIERRIVDVVERFAVRQDGRVNWPAQPGEPPMLMQICHGAPGFVVALASLPSLRATLEAAGEAIFAAGAVRKGTNLCHGDAGNGFALLALFRATGDERWLDRARLFGMNAIARCDAARARHGRGRYSLWTGDLGLACFLLECIHGSARFPTLDVL